MKIQHNDMLEPSKCATIESKTFVIWYLVSTNYKREKNEIQQTDGLRKEEMQ